MPYTLHKSYLTLPFQALFKYSLHCPSTQLSLPLDSTSHSRLMRSLINDDSCFDTTQYDENDIDQHLSLSFLSWITDCSKQQQLLAFAVAVCKKFN